MLADQIAESADMAQNSYQKLVKLRPNDAELLEIYSGFVDTIGNDPEEAKKMLIRATDMRTRQAKLAASGGSSTPAGEHQIDWDSGILTVDASADLGRIVAANTQVQTHPTHTHVHKHKYILTRA
jgi:hypothetical protein